MNRDANASGVGTARSILSTCASHPVLVGLALTLSLVQTQAAHARTFNVPCEDVMLLGVIAAVETNGEEDVVWLAESCTYTLPSPWIVDHDGGSPEGFPVTVHGRGATISGSARHPVFVVNPTAVLDLNGVTVRDGLSTSEGGAIQNLGVLTLTDSVVSDSEASSGGGVVNYENGRLTLIRSSVSGNRAVDLGAGIRNRGGRVTLIDSTVSGNTATRYGSSGGGIHSAGAGARVTLANSTISGNASRFGAGVYSDGGTMAIHDCTLTDNHVLDGGNGGGIYVRSSSVKLAHSIVANSVFEVGHGYECVRDIGGAIVPSNTNLVEDGSCELDGALSGDPLLGPPAGAPAYYPLLPGSPAIDAGTNTQYCAATDQRGEPLQDGDRDGLVHGDLGSYEAAP